MDTQLIRPLPELDGENLLSSRPKSTVTKLRRAISPKKKPSESRAEFLQNLVYDWVFIPIFILIKHLALYIAIGVVMTLVLGAVAIGGTIAAMMVYYTYQMDIEDIVRYAIRIHMRRDIC